MLPVPLGMGGGFNEEFKVSRSLKLFLFYFAAVFK